MEKNPNNPNCSCDELDEDILDEDGYTCYTCFEGNFDKAGDAVIALSVPEIHADILTGYLGQWLDTSKIDDDIREAFENIYNQIVEGQQ
jgi:hypothetical protein